MAKTTLRDWSTTASNNTDVGNIGVQGTNLPSNFDNSQREIMKQVADVVTGAQPVTDTWSFCDPADTTKKFRFDGGGITTATTRVISVPDAAGTLALLSHAQSWTAVQTFQTSSATPPITVERTSAAANASIEFKTTGGSVFAGNSANANFAIGPTNNLSSGEWFNIDSTDAQFNVIAQFNSGIRFAADDSLTYDDATNTYAFASDGTIGGTTVNSGKLRLNDTDDAALASTAHAFQIGPTAGVNLIIDTNEIMSRNNGAASGLVLNTEGGLVETGTGGFRSGGNYYSADHSTPLDFSSTTSSGMTYTNNGPLLLARSAASVLSLQRNTSDGQTQAFFRGTTQVGNISLTTTTTTYNTSSAKPLKENWRDFDSGSIIDGLETWLFDWKNGSGRGYGVLAQDAVNVFPDAVTTDEDPNRWGVDYSKFVPVLLREVKELRKRLAVLEGA